MDGEVIKGHTLLKQDAKLHFQNFFHEDRFSDEKVNVECLFYIPSLVNSEINVGLGRPFSEKEVVDFIWAMELDKAPRPDGFSIHFYRVCWNVIKNDIFCMISSFHKKSKVGGCTNSTFLALIPKDVNTVNFERFLPISLCNASYKILAKLLANRRKPLLGILISPL